MSSSSVWRGKVGDVLPELESLTATTENQEKGTEKFWREGGEPQLQLCCDYLSDTTPSPARNLVSGMDGHLDQERGRTVPAAAATTVAMPPAITGASAAEAGADRAGKSSGRNRRNGKSGKTVQGESGRLTISTPRDRNGAFEPLLIPKHERPRFAARDLRGVGRESRRQEGIARSEEKSRFPDQYLEQQLGLIRWRAKTRAFPWTNA